MSGNRYFFDSNAIIAYLKGNEFIGDSILDAAWIGTSVICIIEFLSFPNLSDEDLLLLNIFLSRIEKIGISDNLYFLKDYAAFKIQSKLKLPDAIIARCAIQRQATLISNDKYFQNINGLSVLQF